MGTGRLASSSPGEAKAGSDGGMARPSVRGTRGSGRGWRQPVLQVRSPVLPAQDPQPAEGGGGQGGGVVDRPPAIGSILVYVCDEQQASCSGGTRTRGPCVHVNTTTCPGSG